MSDQSSHIKFYSLSKVLESVSSVISKNYSQAYWIKAEMIKLNYYAKSGHCYPDLVDKSDNKITAQIRATLWAGNYERTNEKFLKTTGKILADGMTILFLAKIRFDPIYGFSLNILEIDADYELGILAKAKNDCIKKLKSEGVFDANKKLKLPRLPQRIAVISDISSKGYQDFLSITENNSRGYKYFYMLFPSLLQGDGATETIYNQLQRIRKVQHHFDMVAIIRGGGGDAGLDCYNDFRLAKEVAIFPIPVVSGIGHSTNETVVEMVAHFNPITPTDLAYFLQQKFDNNAVAIDDMQAVVEGFVKDYFVDNKNIIDDKTKFVISKTAELLNKQNATLQNLKQSILFTSRSIILGNKTKLQQYSSDGKFNVQKRLAIEDHKLIQFQNAIRSIMRNLIGTQKQKLGFMEQKLELLSPENLLKKGYSITMQNGEIVKDISKLKPGDKIITKLHKGVLESEIRKIVK